MNDDFGPNSKEEHHEGVVVLDSDAIVDPRAVMVKSLYAPVANGAVAGSGSSDDLALGAKVSWIDISE